MMTASDQRPGQVGEVDEPITTLDAVRAERA
jgi:hypothetical protein